jgi:hypothetical protein
MPDIPYTNDDAGIEHLSPEFLVDLMEGSPVAADRRQHLNRCARCREELASISRTLAHLKSLDPADSIPPPRSRIIASVRLRRWAPWLSAAALLLLALLLARDRGGPDFRDRDEGDVSTLGEADALLPSVEEDVDFQVLRVLAEELEGEALADELYDSGTIPSDLLELTPAERRNLLGRLAEDLNTRS